MANYKKPPVKKQEVIKPKKPAKMEVVRKSVVIEIYDAELQAFMDAGWEVR